jgi:hypothetical protein
MQHTKRHEPPPPPPLRVAERPRAHRLLEEDVAARPLPLGVVVGEQLPNVGQAERAQDGVHHRVQQHVTCGEACAGSVRHPARQPTMVAVSGVSPGRTVRVRHAAPVVRDIHATDDQRVSGL